MNISIYIIGEKKPSETKKMNNENENIFTETDLKAIRIMLKKAFRKHVNNMLDTKTAIAHEILDLAFMVINYDKRFINVGLDHHVTDRIEKLMKLKEELK